MKRVCRKLVKYVGRLVKYAIIAVVIWISFCGALWFLGYMQVKFWPPKPMEEMMARNYELHKEEIIDLQDYFKLITDNGKLNASIESSWLGISRICANLGPSHTCYDGFRDDKEKYHKVISSLGWSNEVVKTLKNKLKKINCISIQNFIEPLEIGFKREGFAMYSYLAFNHDLLDEEMKYFNNSCYHYYYKDNVVFESASGVFSPRCFDSKKERKVPGT